MIEEKWNRDTDYYIKSIHKYHIYRANAATFKIDVSFAFI